MNERPIPEAALEDEKSVEMLRVWIASGGLHSSMKIGMYRETMKISEEAAWGRILADVARHVSNAMEQQYRVNQTESLSKIRASFFAQLEKPTTDVKGDFVNKH